MRPYQVALGATGTTPWYRCDTNQAPFEIGFRCSVGPTGSMTYKVQHAFCDMRPQTNITLTRSTTTATLTFISITDNNGVVTAAQPPGLNIGDSILVGGAGAPFDGQYDVAAVPSATSVTYTVANSGPTTASAGANVLRLFVGTNSGVTGATASADGNYAFPIEFMRANITAWTSGVLTMVVNQGMAGS